MATERRREIVLGVVLLVLVFVLYRAWASVGTSEPPSSSPDTRARSAKVAGDEAPQATAPDVRLESLEDDRPQPVESDRNLFRFKPVAPPPEPRPAGRPAPDVAARPPVPTGPPALPPIPLKFIGIVEAPEQSKRIAALVDSTGRSFGGSEGGVVAGQYRILKIGVESIEMVYLDGRGRQTIRLTTGP